VIRLGLRFKKSDGPVLRYLADRVRNGELGPHTSIDVFDNAAEAAEMGQPLEVRCDDPLEVAEMAALYTRLGTSQPVIEDLRT
jgi:hypothetical protein